MFLTFFVADCCEEGSEEQSEVNNEALGQHSSKHTEEQNTQLPKNQWNDGVWKTMFIYTFRNMRMRCFFSALPTRSIKIN